MIMIITKEKQDTKCMLQQPNATLLLYYGIFIYHNKNGVKLFFFNIFCDNDLGCVWIRAECVVTS